MVTLLGGVYIFAAAKAVAFQWRLSQSKTCAKKYIWNINRIFAEGFRSCLP
jgi:hypothetical protein